MIALNKWCKTAVAATISLEPAVLIIVMLATGCGSSSNSGPSVTATATPLPSRSATPLPSGSPTPLPSTGSLSDLQQFLAATYDQANHCYPPSPLCAGSCSSADPDCNTGGKGSGSYTLTQNTNPPGGSDSTSAALDIEPSATPTAAAPLSFDVLYFLKLGPLSSSTQFTYQFNLYYQPAANTMPDALEFDTVQYINSVVYNLSSQCFFGAGCGVNSCEWQIWGLNPQTSQLGWIDSGLGCTPLAADTPHQVSWSYSAIPPGGANQAPQTDYETLTVDGVEMPVNLYEATATSSQPDHLVLQIQQDAHAPLTEWIDAVTFTWSP